ncbi:hypothetical protein DESC_610136 [Desulfosarcina cetonica]|nr:hypothetical protein DESC_610136 [Desulfosarcina cetonica]
MDAGAGPGDNIADRIGNRYDGVVKGGLNVNNPTGDVLSFLFLGLGFSGHLFFLTGI